MDIAQTDGEWENGIDGSLVRTLLGCTPYRFAQGGQDGQARYQCVSWVCVHEIYKRAFWQRGEAGTRGKRGGTGLGLSCCSYVLTLPPPPHRQAMFLPTWNAYICTSC
jgi:hypothetical protein